MESSQGRLSAEKTTTGPGVHAFESGGYNRGGVDTTHRQRCGSIIPTTSSKEIREPPLTTDSKASQKKSKERSNSFVRRARKTLPNLFSTLRQGLERQKRKSPFSWVDVNPRHTEVQFNIFHSRFQGIHYLQNFQKCI